MSGSLDGWDRWAVPLSLGLSFLANDGEELLTMAAHPLLPRRWRSADRLDQRHVNTAIATVGVLYGAAVIDGIRSRGRGWLYQDAQLVFGAHGFSHLAASAVQRRYTTGLVTAPTVVLPQWWWAAGKLKAAGVTPVARPQRAIPMTLVWLAAAHALGRARSRPRN